MDFLVFWWNIKCSQRYNISVFNALMIVYNTVRFGELKWTFGGWESSCVGAFQVEIFLGVYYWRRNCPHRNNPRGINCLVTIQMIWIFLSSWFHYFMLKVNEVPRSAKYYLNHFSIGRELLKLGVSHFF